MRTLLLTAILLTSAWAQISNSVKVNIPFDYSVRGMSAAAGATQIEILGNGRILLHTPAGSYIRQGMVSSVIAKKAELVFRYYGNNRALESIRMGTRGTIVFLPTRQETEWTHLGIQARVEVIPLNLRAD